MINELYVVNTRESKAGNLTIHVGWLGKADGSLGWFTSAKSITTVGKDGVTTEKPASEVFSPGARLTAGDTGFIPRLAEASTSKYVDPADGQEKSLTWVPVDFDVGSLCVRPPSRMVKAVALG